MKKKKILLMLSRVLPELHSGVARYAREHNWHLTSNLAFGGRNLSGWKGDGVITSLGSNQEFVDNVLSFDLPTVDTVGTRPEIHIPRVESNDDQICTLIADDFINRGFVNFAFWGYSGWPVEKLRREFFEKYVTEKNPNYSFFSLSEFNDIMDLPYDDFLQHLANKISDLPKPVGIMAFNDYCGIEILEACNHANISVPEDVAVIGVNNNALVNETLPISLSSVDADMAKRGYEAARLLDKIIDGEKVKQNLNIKVSPMGIVTRQSSDVIAVNNEDVILAIKYIHANYATDIGVPQVVAATNVSRRTLEIAFKTTLNRSILEEIARCRIEAAKLLLITTKLTINKIAYEVGYNYQQPFYNTFAKLEGMTPKEFRAHSKHE